MPGPLTFVCHYCQHASQERAAGGRRVLLDTGCALREGLRLSLRAKEKTKSAALQGL